MLLPSSRGEIKIAKFQYITTPYIAPRTQNNRMVSNLPDAIKKYHENPWLTPQNQGKPPRCAKTRSAMLSRVTAATLVRWPPVWKWQSELSKIVSSFILLMEYSVVKWLWIHLRIFSNEYSLSFFGVVISKCYTVQWHHEHHRRPYQIPKGIYYHTIKECFTRHHSEFHQSW